MTEWVPNKSDDSQTIDPIHFSHNKGQYLLGIHDHLSLATIQVQHGVLRHLK